MKRAYELLCAAEAVVAGVFLLAMVVLVFTGGIARLAGYPLNWAIDLASCLFAWACFMCADIAWRRGNLMSVDIVTDLLSPNLQRLLVLLNYVLIALFLVFVIISGFWLAYVSSARSFQGIPGVSYSWVTASLPVVAMLLLLTTLVKIAEHRRERHGAERGI